MALIDFTLSNARRFYSSMGNPSGLKGLTEGTGFEAWQTSEEQTKMLNKDVLIPIILSGRKSEQTGDKNMPISTI